MSREVILNYNTYTSQKGKGQREFERFLTRIHKCSLVSHSPPSAVIEFSTI